VGAAVTGVRACWSTGLPMRQACQCSSCYSHASASRANKLTRMHMDDLHLHLEKSHSCNLLVCGLCVKYSGHPRH
jgi:hypothetical protein